jgi:hypothetical protein
MTIFILCFVYFLCCIILIKMSLINFVKKNIRIIIIALSVSMWFSATSRLYDLIVPKVTWSTTIYMFIVSSMVLIFDDGTMTELGDNSPVAQKIMAAQR